MLAFMLMANSATAKQQQQFEITPFYGYLFADNTTDVDGNKVSVPSDSLYGVSFAWQDSPNGQGAIMFSHSPRDITLNDVKYRYDINYLHFNGVALFRQMNYITSVALGVGATYISTDSTNVNDGFYPSLTGALGTRYQLSSSVDLVTEARFYATYYKDGNDALLFDTQVTLGVAYKF
jgi:hypothetical protein